MLAAFLYAMQISISRSAQNWKMQNAECKMQNEGIAKGDYLKSFAKQIPQLCIMNYAFRATARQIGI